MGKFLPVIKTAECGSLNRAAQALDYTQPSLAYIINNIESDLGGKLFYRDQRGVTLTENGAKSLEIMRQIEELKQALRQTVKTGQNAVLRLGILPSTAGQWGPSILKRFRA